MYSPSFPPVQGTPEVSTPPEHSRITSSFRRLLAAAVTYLDARIQLACLEGQGALGSVVRLVTAVFTGTIFALLAYLLLIFALVDWMAIKWWEGRHAPAATVVALLHLSGAVALALWAARAASRTTFFHATRRELQKDKQWLTNPHPNSKN
jgi:uncharacterized membrane protein YqjE